MKNKLVYGWKQINRDKQDSQDEKQKTDKKVFS